tara:strand:+ start:689 stop:2806 length:2118 start_codon:yes stop_codon:yes gene_type:complete
MKNTWDKFKHRSVVKIATAYAVVGWVMLQVIEVILPTFNAPEWIAQTLVFTVIMGFPIALLFAWASEAKSSDNSFSTETQLKRETVLTTRGRSFWLTAILGTSFVGLFAFYVSLVLFEYSYSPNDTSTVSSIQSPSDSVYKFRLDLGYTGARGNGLPTEISISPDGKMLAYSVFRLATIDLMLRNLTDFGEDTILVTVPRNSISGWPKFSVNGRWVYYFQDNNINRIRIEGGSPQNIVNSASFGGFAVNDEELIYTKLGDFGLYRFDLNTNEEELIIPGSPEAAHTQPSFIPNTKYILTSFGSIRGYDSTSIELIDIDTRETYNVAPVGFSPRFLSSNLIIFARADALYAQRFNLETMEIAGDSSPILFDVFENQVIGSSLYSISNNGSLAYIDSDFLERASESIGGGILYDGSPAWVGRDGAVEMVSESLIVHGHPRISPNQNEAIFSARNSNGTSDIWVYNFTSDILGRRTFGGGQSVAIWSPDGSRIFYNGDSSISSIASNGTDAPVLEISVAGSRPLSFDNSGESFIYETFTTQGILLSRQENERFSQELNLVPDGTVAKEGRISPNGDFLAYTSNETGRDEVYIRPFPLIENGKWQVSRNGGNHAIWNNENNELFFWSTSDDGKYSVSYETDNGGLDLTEPELMFSSGFRYDQSGPWDYSSSRDQFLLIAEPEGIERMLARQTKLNFIHNWVKEIAPLIQ